MTSALCQNNWKDDVSSRNIIVLAVSGSSSARKAEEDAFKLCVSQEIEILWAIHVVETHLGHYGEMDQLAPGSSKAEYIDYIHDEARVISETLQERLAWFAKKYGIEVRWTELHGQPLQEIPEFVQKQSVTKLIVGIGVKPVSSFGPKKDMAEKLSKECDCQVVIVSVV